MINSIEFENFRGLKHLELPELSQITLLTGRNNAGKSSVLEGIFLFMDHLSVNVSPFAKINSFRRLVSDTRQPSYWESVFYDSRTENPLKILMDLSGEKCSLIYSCVENTWSSEQKDEIVKTEGIPSVPNPFTAYTGATYSLTFEYKRGEYWEKGKYSMYEPISIQSFQTNLPNNQILYPPAIRYINPSLYDDNAVVSWLGNMELKNSKQQIINALRIIEPEISDITTIYRQNVARLHIRVHGQLLPIQLAGDGLNRLLHILLAILENPNSILLIDEIETGFHYSVLESIWKVIAEAANISSCQIIATTHSYECIQNAVSGIKVAGMDDNFCLYRVERRDGENRAFRYDAELTRFAVDTNMEVR